MLKKLYFYVLLLCSITAFSQVKVEGTVIDEITKKPLQGVKIRVNSPRRYAETDSKGRYVLQLPQGDFLLFFSLNGYTTREEVVMIEKERRQLLDPYALSPDYAQEAEQLAVISENELEDDESQADAMSGLLQSSQDVFMRRAAFDFSSVFFKTTWL